MMKPKPLVNSRRLRLRRETARCVNLVRKREFVKAIDYLLTLPQDERVSVYGYTLLALVETRYSTVVDEFRAEVRDGNYLNANKEKRHVP